MPPSKTLSTDDDLKLLYLLHKQTPANSTPKAQTMAAAMNLKPAAYGWRYRALMKRLDNQFADLVDGNGNDDDAAAAAVPAGGKRKRAGGKGQVNGTATTGTDAVKEEDEGDDNKETVAPKKAKVKTDAANEAFKVVKVKQEPREEGKGAGEDEGEVAVTE